MPEIKEHTKKANPPIILAATKCDLCDQAALDAVMAQAKTIGEEVGAVAVLSCSAQTGDGVAVRLPVCMDAPTGLGLVVVGVSNHAYE